MGDGYCEYYWSHCMPCFGLPHEVTFEQWQRIAKLSTRYRRYVNYCTEILPAWKTVEEFHYADNSIEHAQLSKFGQKRQIMVLGPGGD